MSGHGEHPAPGHGASDGARPAQQGPVERMLRKRLDADPKGRPISERARQTQRSVDTYLRAGVRPRWMERLMEIDQAVRRHRRELAAAHSELHDRYGADPAEFARRWRALAERRDFDEVNRLIRDHNRWYPVERDLPMDLRTRDYVNVGGRPYRRRELGADWVLEHFPA